MTKSELLTIKECMLTNNKCYGRAPIVPKGVIVHSTGANNPNLKRYIQRVGGSNDDIGFNKYSNHWNRNNVNKCVHAFIGKDAQGQVAVYQTLPFTQCAWGVGKGKKGSYNYAPRGYIQFEICEDALTDRVYFVEVMEAAAKLCAILCYDYKLPISRVLSHHEAYLEGYASNHGDIDKWLAKFGKTMAWFREEVNFYYTALTASLTEALNNYAPIPAEYYTVVKGDSLSKIANKCGVKLSDVKALNPQIKAPLYIIKVGQRVRVK